MCIPGRKGRKRFEITQVLQKPPRVSLFLLLASYRSISRCFHLYGFVLENVRPSASLQLNVKSMQTARRTHIPGISLQRQMLSQTPCDSPAIEYRNLRLYSHYLRQGGRYKGPFIFSPPNQIDPCCIRNIIQASGYFQAMIDTTFCGTIKERFSFALKLFFSLHSILTCHEVGRRKALQRCPAFAGIQWEAL